MTLCGWKDINNPSTSQLTAISNVDLGLEQVGVNGTAWLDFSTFLFRSTWGWHFSLSLSHSLSPCLSLFCFVFCLFKISAIIIVRAEPCCTQWGLVYWHTVSVGVLTHSVDVLTHSGCWCTDTWCVLVYWHMVSWCTDTCECWCTDTQWVFMYWHTVRVGALTQWVLVYWHTMSVGVLAHGECWCTDTWCVLVYWHTVSVGVLTHSECWCTDTWWVLVHWPFTKWRFPSSCCLGSGPACQCA